jgi:LmbE family N-acetylglucosaminyl deacetylase
MIMFWLGTYLLCAFVALAAALLVRIRWIRRHVRRPALVLGVTLGLCAAGAIGAGLVVFGSDVDAPSWTAIVCGCCTLTLAGAATLVAANRRRRETTPRPRRVLVVAAHPDDLELACGGTLARLSDQGHEVHAIVMSSGGQGGHASTRRDEALAGAGLLELSAISVREFTDTRMVNELEQMVRAVESAVELFAPDVVFTHSQHDQHQDHFAVHLATMRAARRCSTILCFESPSVTTDFAARYFVDISDYLDVKVDAVRLHEDQSAKPYMSAGHLRGTAAYRGSQAKVAHAEGFEIMRALSSDLGEL